MSAAEVEDPQETTASDRAGNEEVQRLHVPPHFEKAMPKGDIIPSEVPSKSQRVTENCRPSSHYSKASVSPFTLKSNSLPSM